MVKISDLRELEVINITNGKRLGLVSDIELDAERGRVEAFIMPGGVKGWMLFKHREEQRIPWGKLVNIGEDVILVELERDWEALPAVVRRPEPGGYDFPEDDEDY